MYSIVILCKHFNFSKFALNYRLGSRGIHQRGGHEFTFDVSSKLFATNCCSHRITFNTHLSNIAGKGLQERTHTHTRTDGVFKVRHPTKNLPPPSKQASHTHIQVQLLTS